SFWVGLLSLYLIQLPLYGVYLVGLILALARWRRHPTVSLLAAAAFAIFLLKAPFFTFLRAWLPLYLREDRGVNFETVGWALSAVNGIDLLLSAAAWVLLLFALFGWRTPPQPIRVPRYDDVEDALPATDTGIRKDRPE